MKSTNKLLRNLSSVRWALGLTSLLALFVFTTVAPFQTEADIRVGKMPKESVAQIKLNTVDGQQFSLASLRGKVVVLDFFGMRCTHSRDHIRETLTQFSEDDFKRGLQIIGIESEGSTAEQVRQFIQNEKINFPVAQIDEPTFIRYVDSKDLSAPQTLIFGRDGKLLLHTMGHSAKNQAAIRETIQKALENR